MKKSELIVSVAVFTLLMVAGVVGAAETSFNVYAPFTFGVNSITTSEDAKVAKGKSSDGRFGLGVNYRFSADSSLFIEKTLVADSSRDIYISGLKFVLKEKKTADILSASRKSDPELQLNDSRKLAGLFEPVSFIVGASKITQNEMNKLDGSVTRRDGYNLALGTEFLAFEKSYLHVVPLRFILTVGQNGTTAFVSTEIGLSLPGF